MQRDLEALQRDLIRFERHTRMMWLAGFAAAVVAVVLWAGARQAQSQSASLSGRQVVLTDDAGRQRVFLASDTNNRPGIWIRDEAGKDRLFFGFGVERAAPQFSLRDENGRQRATAGFSVERGDSQLALSDAAGTQRAYFGFGLQLRTPQLVLNDERGKDRLYAGWTRDGAAIIDVSDESGNVVWKTGDARPTGTSPGAGSPGGGSPGNTRKSGAP